MLMWIVGRKTSGMKLISVFLVNLYFFRVYYGLKR